MSKDSLSSAINVFANINDESINLDEKGKAIKRILSMPTHNSVTKDMMLECIRFLYSQVYEETDKITHYDKVSSLSAGGIAMLLAQTEILAVSSYIDYASGKDEGIDLADFREELEHRAKQYLEWLNSEVTEDE